MAQPKRHPLALPPEALSYRCSAEQFPFKTTAELPSMREIIGQPRGVRAIEFGIDMGSAGYNIFVMGPRGTGRLTAIERFIQARASDDPVPDDWLYVHNFDLPHQPRALRLPAGQGRAFVDDLRAVVGRLSTEIPRAFEAQTFQEAVQHIKRELQVKRDAIFARVQALAAEKGFVIRSTQGGLMLAPVKPDGQTMTPEEYEALTEAVRADLEQRRLGLEDDLTGSLRESSDLEELAQASFQTLRREATTGVLEGQLKPLRGKYDSFPAVGAYLDRMMQDILDHIEDFEAGSSPQPEGGEAADAPAEASDGAAGSIDGLSRYEANLLVDHGATTGAPVIVVTLPTYQNLIGRIEYRVQFGALTTDFTMIKPGALHQANGGFLVVRALDILQQPFAWEALKRAINSEQVCIEEPESSKASVVTTQMLEPEPIPLRLKVIMLGSPMLYYSLFDSEEDFPELFKVKADFAATMDRDGDSEAQYAAFVATRCHEDGLPHFTAAAVARVIEFGAKLAEDQHYLSTRFGEITDLIREAAYYARQAGREVTGPEDVVRAIDERRYRGNLYEELSHRQILDDFVIVETQGQAPGQINGLTVMQLGDHVFGQPSRITARVYMGQGDVVQIEREVNLTGPIHDKGLLTLRGYLGSQYALDFPLTFSASLTFEQSYGGVEGDSASSTELYALLSALSGYPIRQDLAVTGSVDQRGVVQPIGGVTEKIEGFFQICKARGLTGTQGVLIPRANQRNLMVSDEVAAAVEAGQFHVYAVETIDQGIELLMGHPAGTRQPDGVYPPDSVHRAVEDRLRALAEGVRQYTAPSVHVSGR